MSYMTNELNYCENYLQEHKGWHTKVGTKSACHGRNLQQLNIIQIHKKKLSLLGQCLSYVHNCMSGNDPHKENDEDDKQDRDLSC